MNVYSLPFIGSFLKNLDKDIQIIGLQKAMMHIIKRSRTQLILHGKTAETEKILTNKPVIVVANHPYDSEEVAIIAALPSRRDTYLIVNSHFFNVSSSLDTHLIPVYIWHHVTDGKPKKFFGTLLHKLHPTPIYTPEEEQRLNRHSIAKATSIVNKGGVVIIFPGRRSKDGHWFSGVGHLIKGIEKNTDAYIQKIYVRGTSNADYLRMLPFIGKYMPPIQVYFASPMSIKNIVSTDGKQIASTLEDEYTEWYKNLNS